MSIQERTKSTDVLRVVQAQEGRPAQLAAQRRKLLRLKCLGYEEGEVADALGITVRAAARRQVETRGEYKARNITEAVLLAVAVGDLNLMEVTKNYDFDLLKPLSRDQTEFLRTLVILGNTIAPTNKELGQHFKLPEQSVKNRILRISRACGFRTRTQAAVIILAKDIYYPEVEVTKETVKVKKEPSPPKVKKPKIKRINWKAELARLSIKLV